MTLEHRPAPCVRPGAVAAGAVLLAVGVAMLLDTTGVLDINAGRLIGPFVLIGMGMAVLLGGRRGRDQSEAAMTEKIYERRQQRWIGGMWMIGLGCWLLISQTNMFGLTFGTSWPLLLILMGTLIVVRGWR